MVQERIFGKFKFICRKIQFYFWKIQLEILLFSFKKRAAALYWEMTI